jgi:superfamily I DNA/RNA helicase
VIVNTTASKVVVIAAAASGKTRTLVARTQHLLQNGVNPKKIVVITFTNSAAEELGDRLNHPQGLFIGTIHSYANYLLRVAGVDTSRVLDDEKFDQLFPLVKQHPECIQQVDHLLLDES